MRLTYTQPLFPLILLVILTAAYRLLRRRGQRSAAPLIAGITALFLVSWPPVAWLTTGSLESRYPDVPLPKGEAEAIVVLAGPFDPPRPERRDTIVGPGTYLRCQHAAWLHTNWRQLPILACAGGAPGAAAAMRQILVGQGVDPSRIWTDRRSGSTYEDALFAAEILRARGIRKIALVTEATHMPRAELCFRKQGFEVTPAPCGFRSNRWGFGLRELLPGSSAIRNNEDVLHEWVGLAWYWARGRI